MSNISIRKMRVFLAALAHKSFTKASVAENISQPAATIIINQIEEELQCELFQRNGATRRAIATPEGISVAETFSRIVATYDGELASFSASSLGERRQRRILIQTNYDLFIDQTWLSGLIHHYADDDLAIEVMPRNDIVEEVSNRNATLGLIDGNVQGRQLDYAPLGMVELLLAVPENAPWMPSEGSMLSWEDLGREVVFFSNINPVLCQQFQAKIKASGSRAPRVTVCDSSTAIMSLLQAGTRAAIIPDAMQNFFGTWCDCRFFRFNDVTFSGQFGLVTPWGKLNRLPGDITRVRSCFGKVA